MDTSKAGTVPLTELDRSDCLRLLGGAAIGRVIFTESALPAAEPVSYLLDREEVLFRAPHGGRLATAACRAVVGFQVDQFHPETHRGWSVLGVGEAYEIIDPGRLARFAGRHPSDGHLPARIIAIPLQRLTGRRLTLAGSVT